MHLYTCQETIVYNNIIQQVMELPKAHLYKIFIKILNVKTFVLLSGYDDDESRIDRQNYFYVDNSFN